MPRGIPAAVVMLLSSATWAPAQSVVTGTVREDSTTRALRGVEVTIEGAKGSVVTDSAGQFTVSASKGNHIATYRLPGYQLLKTMLIIRRDTVHADATLVRAGATELPTVQVNAKTQPRGGGLREGFEERRAMGFGKFIDSTALRAREEHRVSDVLRELTGVRFMEYRDPQSSIVYQRAYSPLRPPTDRLGACYVSVFYNGSPVYRSERGTGFGVPPDFSRDFSVSSLESIEYYRGASETPGQFGGQNADCGALVLWGRH